MKKKNLFYLMIGIFIVVFSIFLILKATEPKEEGISCIRYTLSCNSNKSAVVHCAANGTGYDYSPLICSNGTVFGPDPDGDGSFKCLFPNQFNLTPELLWERIVNFFKGI